MSEKELIFDAGEMRILRIGCGKCGTRIKFDCANEQSGPPTNCPCCGQSFGEKAGWINGYRRWYNSATTSKDVIFQFQVIVEK